MANNAWPSRRSGTVAPRKGDQREREILDAAEQLLSTRGQAETTVADIAATAGMTRGALYFYFASKEDVLTALVARTVHDLREKSGATLDDDRPVAEVIDTALERTAALWREHGVVMRAAVDLGSSVPAIDELWTGAADLFAAAIAAVLERAGVPGGDGPDGAAAQGRALCWMIERTFYQASRISVDDLDRASRTCAAVWTRVAASAAGAAESDAG